MNEYEINLSQEVTAQVQISLKIKSKKSLEEVQAEIEEMVGEWSRLARMNPSDIEGYIDGTFADELNYEGDDGGEIIVEVSELSSDKKAKKSKKVAAEEAEEEIEDEEEEDVKSMLFSKLTPSKELIPILGSEPLTRAEVSKKLMGYVKVNKLSGPNRTINVDSNLMKITGDTKQVSLVDLIGFVNKYLS